MLVVLKGKIWVKVTKSGFMGRTFITFIFFLLRNAMKHDRQKNAIYHVDFRIKEWNTMVIFIEKVWMSDKTPSFNESTTGFTTKPKNIWSRHFGPSNLAETVQKTIWIIKTAEKGVNQSWASNGLWNHPLWENFGYFSMFNPPFFWRPN